MDQTEIALFLSETLAGRYRPAAHLGSGGFAGAFLATDDRSETEVAAKILKISQCSDPDARREFRDEVDLLGKLRDCDRVIRRLDSGDHVVSLRHPLSGGSISVTTEFVVLELAAGSLADLLLYGASFTWSDRLRLYRDVVKGVHQMHLRRIVHRDVKRKTVSWWSILRPRRSRISGGPMTPTSRRALRSRPISGDAGIRALLPSSSFGCRAPRTPRIRLAPICICSVRCSSSWRLEWG